MRVDVFDDDDRVVDDKTDRGRYAAERHQIERESDEVHREERDEYRYRYHDDGDERRSHVSKEGPKNNDRQDEADDDRIADRVDRIGDHDRLIVERSDLNILRQRLF